MPLGDYLSSHEDAILKTIIKELSSVGTERDRGRCDSAFGHYTHQLLYPYAGVGLVTRAAAFARDRLIPDVLNFEATHPVNFHKGALFYDTALAHLVSGDEQRFEYFLAMVDEEEYRTHGVEGKPQKRGETNLRTSQLSKVTIEHRVRFASSLLNGGEVGYPANYEFLFGRAMNASQFDNWRQTLPALDHFELFRLLHDAEIFCGVSMPGYKPVRDNPYIMLRLVKALSQLAQWVESRLTVFQRALPAGTIKKPTLSRKLGDDLALSALVSAAGNVDRFAGTCPKTTSDTDAEIRQLLNDLQVQSDQDQKDWRVLRLLYIIRNCTAHQIDEALAFYTDRKLLLELLQVVFLSCFVIEKRKTGTIP
jgi:hypothetical protein